MFCTSLDHRPPLWPPNNIRHDPANMIPHKHTGQSTMGYWGWMTSGGPGDLVEINGKRIVTTVIRDKMNSREYVDILENPERAVDFVQDNSAVRTAHIVQNYLALNSYNVIVCPAKSPDLNVIEDMGVILQFAHLQESCW
nr:unnamed protein product [Callosobruchus chinensis]